LIRLHALVEGQTEEAFVNEVLAPELAPRSIFVDAHCITTGRRRGWVNRGGHVAYEHLVRDLELWMKQDQGQESWFTTMVDLYRLPPDFPGYTTFPLTFALDVHARLAELPVARRMIPYVQTHEFEALLFADPLAFLSVYPDRGDAVRALCDIRAQFDSPEHINNGDATAPSKRIRQLFPDFTKVIAGPQIAQQVSIPGLVAACPRFGGWLAGLLALAPQGPGPSRQRHDLSPIPPHCGPGAGTRPCWPHASVRTAGPMRARQPGLERNRNRTASGRSSGPPRGTITPE